MDHVNLLYHTVMGSDDDFEVKVCSGWMVKKNPEGNGLLLVVARGCPSWGDNHKQLVSCYSGDTPMKEDVEFAIQQGWYEKRVDNLINELKGKSSIESEKYALGICFDIITDITRDSARGFHHRHQAFTQNFEEYIMVAMALDGLKVNEINPFKVPVNNYAFEDLKCRLSKTKQ